MINPPPQQVFHLLITGRVQGVGFRWFARERARLRGLRGWVRNLPDGTVEVLAEGSAEVVADFIADLWRGPDGAAVHQVRQLTGTDNLVADNSGPGVELPFPFQISRQPPT